MGRYRRLLNPAVGKEIYNVTQQAGLHILPDPLSGTDECRMRLPIRRGLEGAKPSRKREKEGRHGCPERKDLEFHQLAMSPLFCTTQASVGVLQHDRTRTTPKKPESSVTTQHDKGKGVVTSSSSGPLKHQQEKREGSNNVMTGGFF